MRKTIRKSSPVSYCTGCFEKQQRIDDLEEQVKNLKDKLKYRQEKDKQPFFGSSTPSSKLPVKKNSLEENRKRQGGAKPDHKGNDCKRITKDNADKIIELAVEEGNCTLCRGELVVKPNFDSFST